MKHSVRYIKVTYNKRGSGRSICFLRGMYIRQWRYTSDNFARIVESTSDRKLWNVQTSPDEITFERIYPVG